MSWTTVTVQVKSVPTQSPDHFTKDEPFVGVAEKVTAVPLSNSSLHVTGHLMLPESLVMTPVP